MPPLPPKLPPYLLVLTGIGGLQQSVPGVWKGGKVEVTGQSYVTHAWGRARLGQGGGAHSSVTCLHRAGPRSTPIRASGLLVHAGDVRAGGPGHARPADSTFLVGVWGERGDNGVNHLKKTNIPSDLTFRKIAI